MRFPDVGRGRSAYGRVRQRGQALVYGLFVLIGGLAALFFLFNTGQLTREKTKLVIASDAVAYSGGVMHARTLNFQAYTNRAMLANTVAIAQLVSLSSWVRYTNNMASFGLGLGHPKFIGFYPSYLLARASGLTLETTLNQSGALSRLAGASDSIIRGALMNAQQVASLGLVPVRLAVMNEVAQANYRNDGTVTVDPVPLTVNEYANFVTRYSGADRTRFADVARISADKDGFLRQRSWSMPALFPSCPGAMALGRTDWLDRRGGTELIGFDQWQAMDTLSEKQWVPRNKWDPFCQALTEVPSAWGQTLASDRRTFDTDVTHYDSSVLVNPGSSVLAMASSSAWGYSGIPSFYDLSSDALSQADPRLLFAVRLKRDKTQTATSGARSNIRATSRLNDYTVETAGGNDFVAVSASEVYFQREGSALDNVYGRSDLSRPREVGSLFNPYWQVHLIQSDENVRKAQLLQGVALP